MSRSYTTIYLKKDKLNTFCWAIYLCPNWFGVAGFEFPIHQSHFKHIFFFFSLKFFLFYLFNGLNVRSMFI